jgi:two-component sensor histidine kinase
LIPGDDGREAARALKAAQAQLGEAERRARDLQTELDRKTTLLQEIDHRMKNNLQIVSSLVLLKARRVPDKAAQQALYNMSERISALTMVHRLLHAAEDVSRFDVGALIADLSDELIAAAEPGQIALDLRLEPVSVPSSSAAPLAFLLNELVTNAVRHAFPAGRRGTLTVSTIAAAHESRIVVEDDGVGLGRGDGGDTGFGRSLAEMLARQIQAELEWEDADPGTRVVVTLPILEERPSR